MPKPYGEDVTEEVFLRIEGSPHWLRRYTQLCNELRPGVVNKWIGKYTKDITGLNSLRQVEAKRSNLITSYTKLAPR